ncbi:DUF1294 domain-containing protein [Thioalkalivibrio sulfidiphilus]|uniref:DUF1294 domain-containing protein n=1 Tax=Thioalkalivibrio sulfidiphilus TaxID=1033854 RepID=UPI003BAEBE93
MRAKGRIYDWKDDRGFGFIRPNVGGKEVFVHIRSFNNRTRRPVKNEIVTYDLVIDDQGRPRAEKVAFAGERVAMGSPARQVTAPLVFAGVFLSLVTVSVLVGLLPVILLVWYLAACLVTFSSYALDKSAARQGRWRTQESTLHLFSLAGGWPGALMAQQRLRHKSRKQPFQTVFWLTVLLNCVALGWLLSPMGTELRELMAAWS